MVRAVMAALGVLAACWSVSAAVAEPSGSRQRSEFRKQFERPRVTLSPTASSVEQRNGLTYEKLSIASEAGVRVPLLVVRPAESGSRRPAVVALHGLGGNKEGLTPYLEGLARRGIIGVALDARYHGERGGDLQGAMIRSFRDGKEHPYLWDTVWDTWRVLDYLETRPEVDAKRLGVTGFSLGGHTTWMVSADPRVRVAVPCIAVCSWRWQLEHEGYRQRVANLSHAFDGVLAEMHQPSVTPAVVAEAWRHWLPGIPERYDCQDLLAAYAPRPLLIIGGDSDPVAPLEGARAAIERIEAAYRDRSASERLRVFIAEKSGHTVTPAQQDALFEWFVRWLKP